MTEKIREQIDRITSYLSNGGLFNPELMEHDKVRDLLIDNRDTMQAMLDVAESAKALLAAYDNMHDCTEQFEIMDEALAKLEEGENGEV